jgi:Plasmid stabilisation system protein.
VVVVKWKVSAYRLFNEHVETARIEYGQKTAERWISEAAEIFARLQRFPESYTPEPLLKDKKRKYRSCRMMGGRFRMVYYFNPSTNIARIVDIWDTRMNPETLMKRIK